jgi:hypothetical protein
VSIAREGGGAAERVVVLVCMPLIMRLWALRMRVEMTWWKETGEADGSDERGGEGRTPIAFAVPLSMAPASLVPFRRRRPYRGGFTMPPRSIEVLGRDAMTREDVRDGAWLRGMRTKEA